jgi:MinD-like ATPase involved in chromosome partitioning or flagellar assembly
MINIILADARPEFGHELSNRIMVDERPIALNCVISLDAAASAANAGGTDAVLVCENLANGALEMLLPYIPQGVKVAGYAMTPGGIIAFRDIGIPCLGLIAKPSKLLDAIESGEIENSIPVPSKAPQEVSARPFPQPQTPVQEYAPVHDERTTGARGNPPPYQRYGAPAMTPPPDPGQARGYPPAQGPAQGFDPRSGREPYRDEEPYHEREPYPEREVYPAQAPYTPRARYPEGEPYSAPYRGQRPYPEQNPYPEREPRRDESRYPARENPPGREAYPASYREPYFEDQRGDAQSHRRQDGYPPPPSYPYPPEPNVPPRAPGQGYEYPYHPKQGYERAPEAEDPYTGDAVSAAAFDPEDENRATVVTIYSAKGGVGKTTIAAELSAYLALTNPGDGKYRVCVIDCNIDFGNIATTLNFDAKGVNMSHFAAEIRERARKGEPYESIEYGRADLEDRWLQQIPETGLYGLIAPDTHEDSIEISEAELSSMIRSIVKNGEFDFVVCDTGNNTRSSAIIALESADFVFMVATQDVTTADCNDAFIATMRKYGYDIDKIRLIVNMIRPFKSTGIRVEEIEEAFDFPCVARIDECDDVIKANNFGQPLIYNPKHKFTAQMKRIVMYVTGQPLKEGFEEKKKGFFGFKRR